VSVSGVETIRDLIQVWTTDAGSPDRLVHAGRRWRVSDKPTLWMGRIDWWSIQGLDRPSAADLEQEMWSFRATADDGEKRMFDVARDRVSTTWWLISPTTE
jgi:hypothetical protein